MCGQAAAELTVAEAAVSSAAVLRAQHAATKVKRLMRLQLPFLRHTMLTEGWAVAAVVVWIDALNPPSMVLPLPSMLSTELCCSVCGLHMSAEGCAPVSLLC